MEEEIDILKSALKNKEDGKLDCYQYSKGTIGEKDIIVLKTNVGMVNAAISTTLAIKKFHPTFIINQGTIGSHTEDILPFDFIVATKAINTSSRIDNKDFPPYYFEDNEWKRGHLSLNTSSIESVCNKLKNKKGKIYKGAISSCDAWTKDKEAIKMLHNQYNTIGEEMETFASLQVAKLYGVAYVSIRVVSNNELKNQPYDVRTSQYLQNEIINLIINSENF